MTIFSNEENLSIAKRVFSINQNIWSNIFMIYDFYSIKQFVYC